MANDTSTSSVLKEDRTPMSSERKSPAECLAGVRRGGSYLQSLENTQGNGRAAGVPHCPARIAPVLQTEGSMCCLFQSPLQPAASRQGRQHRTRQSLLPYPVPTSALYRQKPDSTRHESAVTPSILACSASAPSSPAASQLISRTGCLEEHSGLDNCRKKFSV